MKKSTTQKKIPPIISIPLWEEQFRKAIGYGDGTYTVTTEQQSYEVKIEQDTDPGIDPMVDFDMASHFLFEHRKYTLGHRKHWDELGINCDDFNGWDELKAWLIKNADAAIVIPVRMYDHSGITISASGSYPYNDHWDSGCIGLAYMSKKDILENFQVKRLSKETMVKANNLIVAEIGTYDDYLTGNIYGYTIEGNKCGNDSCWGYYGDVQKSGIIDEIISMIKHEDQTVIAKRKIELTTHANQLKQQIKNRVPLIYRKKLILNY